MSNESAGRSVSQPRSSAERDGGARPQGVLLCVCGPSGVGKTTLSSRLLDRHETLDFSVSVTTRPRRGEEVDGENYKYVDRETFEAMRRDDAFAEWAEVHGNLYGTTIETIRSAWAEGTDLLFDIDYQGAEQLKARFPNCIAVMVVPPSMEVLESRLVGRGTEAEEVREERIEAARHELEQYDLFDFIVENQEIDAALDVLESIYVAARHRLVHKRPKIDELLDETR